MNNHELYRQEAGINFTIPRVYNFYIDTLEGTDDTDKFGSGEVDLPQSDEGVHRHLSYLALRLGITDLTRSDLWTVAHPIGIEFETTDGVQGYRYHLERTSGNQSYDETNQDSKKRKLQTTTIDVDSDEDLRAWIAELPEDLNDMEPSQVSAYHELTVPDVRPRDP